jgi:HEAT repeats/PBS lyase HEAT-like repeat
MKRRSVIVVLILAAILIAAGFIIFFQAPEPSAKGKTLTAWIDDFIALNGANNLFPTSDPGKRAAVTEAFKEMGTNCIPFIFRRLERQDAPIRTGYRNAWPKIPGLLRRILHAPKPVLDASAAWLLIAIAGPVPPEFFLPATKSPNSTARQVAAQCIMERLRSNAPEAEVLLVMPRMIELLKDPNKRVRVFSAGALGQIGPRASNAVPALILALNDNDLGPTPGSKVPVRAWAMMALGRIGPAAASAVPALQTLQNDPDGDLQWKAAFAIWQIDSNAAVALPVMIRQLPTSHEKWGLISNLGWMGPAAKDAVPALERELDGADTFLRTQITNALNRIDPAAAAKLGTK